MVEVDDRRARAAGDDGGIERARAAAVADVQRARAGGVQGESHGARAAAHIDDAGVLNVQRARATNPDIERAAVVPRRTRSIHGDRPNSRRGPQAIDVAVDIRDNAAVLNVERPITRDTYHKIAGHGPLGTRAAHRRNPY